MIKHFFKLGFRNLYKNKSNTLVNVIGLSLGIGILLVISIFATNELSMDKFHDNYDHEKGRADSLDNIVKVLDEMPPDKRAMHRIHVITIVSKDPNSFLPEEMKEYYGAKGITFGDFPMQPIGRAKNLMDEMPDTAEFFKNTPPPEEGPKGMPIATLIGDYYSRGNEKVAKLGHLKDLFLDATTNT